MPVDPHRLLALDFSERRVAYADRDAMLYALATGMAANAEGEELDFVYEPRLKVMPSFATILGFDDTWIGRAGIDLARVVHGAQRLTWHRPFPPRGAVAVRTRISGIIDKGEGRGALVLAETQLTSEADGAHLSTGLSTLFVRGGGGFGGSVGEEPRAPVQPERPADAEIEVATAPNQALLFRLLGDRNPLHADPETSRAAGFERPILHGAATYGIACATALRHLCGFDPAALASLSARFAGPVYPGETLVFALWHEGSDLFFRATSAGRGNVVLDQGHAARTER